MLRPYKPILVSRTRPHCAASRPFGGTQWCSEAEPIAERSAARKPAPVDAQDRSVWGQRRVPHSDARRVVGGIVDRGCCTDNADLIQSASSRYAWRRFRFLEKGLLDRVESSPSASPSAVVISAAVGNRERQADDGPPTVEQH